MSRHIDGGAGWLIIFGWLIAQIIKWSVVGLVGAVWLIALLVWRLAVAVSNA